MTDTRLGKALLERACRAWNAGAAVRRSRSRNKRFTYGDQWSDPAPDGKRNEIERESILRTGKQPYTNNLIRQMVKTIVGRYRRQAREDGLYRGEIADIAVSNELEELDARLLEEFLISGCAVQRIVAERRWGGRGVWIDNVSPDAFFVSPFRDPRGWDINLIGMVHDMTFPELVNRFAGGSNAREEKLHALYAPAADAILGDAVGADGFLRSTSSDKCRVIEVWSIDSHRPDAKVADREFVWHCRFLSPDGFVLAEYDSPYSHAGHPFVIKYYPLTDGEVHAFVEDVLDQQKFINRLIVMLDHILACSAKGVLLFPEGELPKNISWEEVVERWAQADGVIPVTGATGNLPTQVVMNAGNSGAFQMLQLEMQLFEKISGVGDVLSGRDNGTARGAGFYDAQIRNATIAMADLFDTFSSFVRARTAKALAVRISVQEQPAT